MPFEALKDVGVTGVRWSALQTVVSTLLADLAQNSKAQLLAIPVSEPARSATVESSSLRPACSWKVLSEPVALPSPETLDAAGRKFSSRCGDGPARTRGAERHCARAEKRQQALVLACRRSYKRHPSATGCSAVAPIARRRFGKPNRL